MTKTTWNTNNKKVIQQAMSNLLCANQRDALYFRMNKQNSSILIKVLPREGAKA